MDVCAASVDRGTCWRPSVLICANEGIDSRPYENRTTFFFLVPGGQRRKICIQNVHYCSLKIGLRFFQSAASKKQKKKKKKKKEKKKLHI